MNEDRRCASCANWRPVVAASVATPLTTLGECHRYAPHPAVVTEEALSEGTVVWPVTAAQDACGEWFYGGDRLDKGAPVRAGSFPVPKPPA